MVKATLPLFAVFLLSVLLHTHGFIMENYPDDDDSDDVDDVVDFEDDAEDLTENSDDDTDGLTKTPDDDVNDLTENFDGNVNGVTENSNGNVNGVTDTSEDGVDERMTATTTTIAITSADPCACEEPIQCCFAGVQCRFRPLPGDDCGDNTCPCLDSTCVQGVCTP